MQGSGGWEGSWTQTETIGEYWEEERGVYVVRGDKERKVWQGIEWRGEVQ